jgi:ribosomal protein S18 acetylase RimI-like enzyme
MATTGALARRETFTGLRPVRPRADLQEIANLIEICFAPTLDAAGRSAIQDMRTLGRARGIMWLFARLARALPPLYGFVWLERGQLVGNVTLTPAEHGGGWVIANVAVLPAYRRRGIARRLMLAALDFVARRHSFAVLQVEADNAAARALYASLGFREQRTFTHWRCPARQRPALVVLPLASLRPLTPADVPAVTALAERVRPNERGGLGWLRPVNEAAFRPQRFAALRYAFGGARTDIWLVPGTEGQPVAVLRLETRLGSLARSFDALIAPEYGEQLAAPLIGSVLRRLVNREHAVVTEHPADDEAMNAALREHLFRPERTLVHMIWVAGSDGRAIPYRQGESH